MKRNKAYTKYLRKILNYSVNTSWLTIVYLLLKLIIIRMVRILIHLRIIMQLCRLLIIKPKGPIGLKSEKQCNTWREGIPRRRPRTKATHYKENLLWLQGTHFVATTEAEPWLQRLLTQSRACCKTRQPETELRCHPPFLHSGLITKPALSA